MDIKLGYEIGTGKKVSVKNSHLIVTGVTQLSGKTTTLEALIKRSGLKAIVFKTKVGERGFNEGTLIPPYFRERFDWEYVLSLLEATMKERLKFQRSWVIRACETATSLVEVKNNIDESLANPKMRSLDRSVLTELQAFFNKVLPQLQYANFSRTLEFRDGINIMDLEQFSSEIQSLVIRSVLETVLKDFKNTIIVVPECWKFLPQTRGSPVKQSAEEFIRQGATNNNFMWIDSIPNYEAVLVKVNGKIRSTTMENLFDDLDGQVKKTLKNEEIKTVHNVQVLGSDQHMAKWVDVEKIIKHPYNGKLLTINTGGGVIDVSPNHPVMKYPKYLVEASTIKIGDRLCMRKIHKTNLTNNNVGFFVGTNELAWLMGFYAAEGWIHKKHVLISNSRKECIDKSKRAIWDNFHLSASYKTARRGVYTLDTASLFMVSFFKQFYVSEKFNSRTKTVPESIMNANINIKKAFLEGYLAGDGGFDKQRGMYRSLTSVSRPLLLGILELMRATKSIKGLSVHIREDKVDVVQIILNKTEDKRKRMDIVKKIREKNYSGYLYDFGVDSPDHTFYLGIGNTRVHNSQDMTNVDKTPLKQISTWILGLQTEKNEVIRTLDQIPLPKNQKPKPNDIMTLQVGHFYKCSPQETIKVYVQPAWLDDATAKKVAMGKTDIDKIEKPSTLSSYSMPLKSACPVPESSGAETQKFYTKLYQDMIELRQDFFSKLQEQRQYIDKIGEQVMNFHSNKPEINTDEIVSLVLQKMPAQESASINNDELSNMKNQIAKLHGAIGGLKAGTTTYEVAPLEKIKKVFLEEIKTRIIGDVDSISSDAKKVLKYIEAKQSDVSPSELITKCLLLKVGGSQSTKMSGLLKELMVIEVTQRTAGGRYRAGLNERIKSLMENHSASEQEIDQVYNHILAELLNQ